MTEGIQSQEGSSRARGLTLASLWVFGLTGLFAPQRLAKGWLVVSPLPQLVQASWVFRCQMPNLPTSQVRAGLSSVYSLGHGKKEMRLVVSFASGGSKRSQLSADLASWLGSWLRLTV